MEKKIEGKTVYENRFLAIDEDRVLLENRHLATRIVVRHIGAAAVLALTKDDKVILTSQFRYPIRRQSIEIPAGKRDSSREDPKDTVMRELYEETGYQTDKWRHLRTIHPCVGYSDETIDLFLAQDCVCQTDTPPLDDDEDIKVMLVTKDEVKTLLDDGSITDSKTLIGLYAYINLADKDLTT